MIWLTWRQHRRQALFTLIGLAALAALIVPTGLQMHHAFTNSGLAACLHRVGRAEMIPTAADQSCQGLIGEFNTRFGVWNTVGPLFIFLPLLFGIFWGAPLVAREIEHGTHRLVWTQGVSRRHWALVKFGLVGGAVLVVAVGYALGVSWWLSPLNQAGDGRLQYLRFDVLGVVPIGYTLFSTPAPTTGSSTSRPAGSGRSRASRPASSSSSPRCCCTWRSGGCGASRDPASCWGLPGRAPGASRGTCRPRTVG